MEILICGISGFVGKNLENAFIKKGWNVNSISKNDFQLNENDFAEKIEGNDVIINLCGAPILRRWTNAYKNTIYNSRITTTTKIADSIQFMKKKPSVFISTSAVGIYAENYRNTESDCKLGNGFLANLCINWEKAILSTKENTRTVIFRLGVVLGKDGGAFPKMVAPFKFGLGGKLGNGKQPFPWIYIDDLISAYIFAIENHQITGEYNLVSPETINNKEFTKMLSKFFSLPSFFRVPSFLLKILYGKASETLLNGQTVIPKKLLNQKFEFKYANLEKALTELFKK
ncbi:MAG: TIGR01777 family protein [Bacteroidetes bacterium]|nr:TIGR01777 family protein [Bacteroidota bacterium]